MSFLIVDLTVKNKIQEKKVLIGIDIIDLKKIQIIERKDSIMQRLFTPVELDSVGDFDHRKRITILASIFAGKEAAVKALGTGFNDIISVQDIQIKIERYNKGKVEFLGEAKKLVDEMGIVKTQFSFDAGKNIVVAAVILETRKY